MDVAEAGTRLPAPPLDETDPSPDWYTVPVFYGTDRGPAHLPGPAWWYGVPLFGISLVFPSLVRGLSFLIRKRSPINPLATGTLRSFSLVGACGAVFVWSWPLLQTKKNFPEYGPERGDLRFGLCSVSIPKDHRIGKLESPSIFSFRISQDPKRDVVLLDAVELPEDEFVGRLQESLKKAEQNGERLAFVFVHGYNVSFEDAARRTAQLWYDLKFPGPAILYSWPAQGAILAYSIDENNAEWTVPDLTRFLQLVATKTGATKVHLIAHSMGNRCMINALQELNRQQQADLEPSIFSELVLTAPDVDAGIFRQKFAAFVSYVKRVTLYASSNDRALLVSKEVNGYPRAGDSGESIIIEPPMQTVDVSLIETDFLGHSYFGDNATVVSDLFYVLRGLAPSGRSRLKVAKKEKLEYWVFNP
jgi:esterase/lipase superfamily enzyme